MHLLPTLYAFYISLYDWRDFEGVNAPPPIKGLNYIVCTSALQKFAATAMFTV